MYIAEEDTRFTAIEEDMIKLDVRLDILEVKLEKLLEDVKEFLNHED